MKTKFAISRRLPFFYGWVIAASLGVVTAISMNMGGINFGFFIKPMENELGISHAIFGWAQTGRLIGFALTSFFIGKAIDRYGARIPLLIAGTLMGAVVASLSVVTVGWHLIALFILIGAIGMHGGGGNLYASVPIAKWFVRKRGKAMGIMALGGPIGIAIATPVTQLLIREVGWRNAWLLMGGFGGIAIILLALFFVRRQPQDMGLQPDGEHPPTFPVEGQKPNSLLPSPSNELLEAEHVWTRKEATRSWAFWSLTISFGLFMFAISTIGLFRVPYFVDQGFQPQLVAFMFTAEAIAAAIITVPTGILLDRFDPRYIGLFGFFGMCVAFWVTIIADSSWLVFASGILFGSTITVVMILQNVIWPVYFGGKHIGAIRGFSMPVIMAFSAIGAPLTGTYKDVTGSYLPIWWTGIALIVVGAILLIFTPKPQKQLR